jgi:hypothetical protein
MSNEDNSRIERLVDAIWRKASTVASRTYHRAIDDMAGIEDGAEDSEKSPKSTTPGDEAATANERAAAEELEAEADELLHDAVVYARSWLARFDKSYREISKRAVGADDAESDEETTFERVTGKTIRTILDLTDPATKDAPLPFGLGEKANEVASWLGKAVTEGALDGMGAEDDADDEVSGGSKE